MANVFENSSSGLLLALQDAKYRKGHLDFIMTSVFLRTEYIRSSVYNYSVTFDENITTWFTLQIQYLNLQRERLAAYQER